MALNFARLRAFLAVVDEGGFGAALGLTQSAVSHAVATLERTLGHAVLSRGGCEQHVRQAHAGHPFTPRHRVRELGTLLAMVCAGVSMVRRPRPTWRARPARSLSGSSRRSARRGHPGSSS